MCNSEKGIGGYIAVALVTAVIVYSFASYQQEQPTAALMPTVPPAMPTLEPTGAPTSTPPPIPKPVPYYDSAEGTTYYYGVAVSEEDKKTGKRAPDMVAFRYLGRDDLGKDRVQRVFNGAGSRIAVCSRPCKVIHYNDGTAVGYDEGSIIGSVFRDAQRGFLKVYSAPKPKAEPKPEVAPWDDYPGDPVAYDSEAPAAE